MLFAGAVFLAGGVFALAAITVFAPAPQVPKSLNYATVKVAYGHVGSTLDLNAMATWPSAPAATNLAQGRITTVEVTKGRSLSVGTRLYSVDLHPVFIAEGAVPSFRALQFGDSGTDVTQLQRFLTAVGHFPYAADGHFQGRTRVAVEAWQRAEGAEPDGVVQAADLIYVPHLPLTGTPDTRTLKVGNLVAGGENVLDSVPGSAIFSIAATDEQAAAMSGGTRVDLTSPSGGSWLAKVSGKTPGTSGGGSTVRLAPVSGSTICGKDCTTIPLAGETAVAAKVVTIPTVTGLIVPTSAIRSEPNGRLVLVDSDGVTHAVKVTVSARGMSIITGVDDGTLVRIPATGGP